MISEYTTDSVEALEAINSAGVTNVWIHGSKTFVTTEEVVKTSRKSKSVAETPVEEEKVSE